MGTTVGPVTVKHTSVVPLTHESVIQVGAWKYATTQVTPESTGLCGGVWQVSGLPFNF